LRTIDLYFQPGSFPVSVSTVRHLAELCLGTLELITPVAFSLSLVTREEIAQINKEYRHKQGPTDTITFALEDEKDFIQSDEYPVRQLGDIFICYPVVQANARMHHKSVDEEFAYVFVHSLLHLLGYDHDTSAKKKCMFGLTERIIGNAI